MPPLIQALLDPAAYPEPRPATVELRQTHISYVLLAGERVYKVKKPVALGFLDYSTPRRRAYYCWREVALNRRFAPDVYLGIEPITGERGAVEVGGHGRVLERAVVMRRLPEAGMLTNLLATGTATLGLLDQVARRVAGFHAAAASGPRVARFGYRLIDPPAVGRGVGAVDGAGPCAAPACGHRAVTRRRGGSGACRGGYPRAVRPLACFAWRGGAVGAAATAPLARRCLPATTCRSPLTSRLPRATLGPTPARDDEAQARSNDGAARAKRPVLLVRRARLRAPQSAATTRTSSAEVAVG